MTAAGRAEVEAVAARAHVLGVRADRCVHSGKLRAEQTATILADALGATPEARSGLSPSDPVGPVADWLRTEATAAGGLAVVGHLPFLDRLASVLVAGDEHAHVVRFRNAGLVALAETEDGFAVSWVLLPELVD
ncbi:MAG: histidine phosphatase family protein [Actinomycetes bacterium]|nr:histidine phosphatase family protein [Actinomycetes bacterium]